MRKLVRPVCVAAACAAVAVTGCSSSSDSGGGEVGSAKGPLAKKANKALDQLSTKVLSKGPYGETAASASSVRLSSDDIAKIKAKKATAAIALHYGGNDWSNAQVDGLKSEFAKLGIKVIATTDANFKPDKQVSDIETALAKKPDILVSIPTDPVATAGVYKKAAKQGTKLVFMDNVPKGMKPGRDYVSVVSADNYGNGVATAHLMAEALNGKGKVGIVHHEADFYVTKQRYEAFKATLKRDYPDIKIAADQGVAGPDFAGDGEKVASGMLTKNADLDAIWAVWDVPAEGVLAGARSNGRSDLKIITLDLGQNVAIDMAKKGPIKALSGQRPFDQGTTEAKLAAYGLLGKKAPPYVALNALPVVPSDLAKDWKTVYHSPLPAKVRKAQ